MIDRAHASTETRTFIYGGASFDCRLDAEDRAHVMRCRGAAGDVRVPESLGGHEVAGLDEGAFARLGNVERVELPRTLREVGARAFEGCLRLREARLNEGLLEIGEEAFSLCPALDALALPSTLRHVGANFAGERPGAGPGARSRTIVSAHPGNPHLVLDGQGALYERCGDGLVLADGSRITAARFSCLPETLRIGDRALAQLPALQTVGLPEGLLEIGDEAFRGSVSLCELMLPATLRSIGFAAFSRTALPSLHLPAACTELDPDALFMGPITRETDVPAAHLTSLAALSADAGNPFLRSCGPVLCRRIGEGAFEAFAAPLEVADAHLGADVIRICASTFTGTRFIGSLSLHEGTALPEGACATAAAAVGRVALLCAEGALDLPVPAGEPGRRFLDAALTGGTADGARIAHAYDEALRHVSDGLAQARLVIARLAAPTHLSPADRASFEAFADGQFDAICASFGARNETSAFEQMADAGLLDAERVARAVELLSRLGHTQSAGSLLELRRQRFAGGWDDYEL